MSAWNEKLLRTLQKHHPPAIGFVNAAMCGGRGVICGVTPANSWENHTAHHVDLNSVTPSAFERDVIAGESPLRNVVWFRYPFLHTGPSRAVRDEIASFLKKRGYRNAVVTIDSDEYLYNNAYAAALEQRDRAHAKRIAAAYFHERRDRVRRKADARRHRTSDSARAVSCTSRR